MPTVHATAIVDTRAQLADDVEVGPHCIIEGDVRIGAGTRLLHRVSLKGPLTLGQRNTLYPNVCIGYEPQDRKFDPKQDGAGVVIGDDNILREGMTIHRATQGAPTTLGHRNYMMGYSHVGHDVVVGNDCTFGNGVLVAGHAHVADRVIFGGNAVVHQFCRVGRLAMMSGVEGITRDLPPFCIVYHTRTVGSLNLVGLRRSGYQRHIDNLKHAFNILYRQRLLPKTAADVITREFAHDALCMELVDFVRSSRRGICSYGGTPSEADAAAE